LEEDIAVVEGLVAEMAGYPERQALSRLYPRLRAHLKLHLEALAETLRYGRDRSPSLLAQLQDLDLEEPGSSRWWPLFRQLAERAHDFFERERRDLFPRLRESHDEVSLRRLANTFRAEKEVRRERFRTAL
jgi:hypothetical protein